MDVTLKRTLAQVFLLGLVGSVVVLGCGLNLLFSRKPIDE